MTASVLDAAGRRRSPATMPGYLCGRPPKNKGMRYPADPPRAEEIIAVMRVAGANAHRLHVRALIAVLWPSLGSYLAEVDQGFAVFASVRVASQAASARSGTASSMSMSAVPATQRRANSCAGPMTSEAYTS